MLSLLVFVSIHVASPTPVAQPIGDHINWATAKKRGSKRGKTAPAAARAKPAMPALPADVRNFMQRRDLCDHLRGEESYDPQRAEELEEGMEKNCSGSDKELRDLRKAYAKNPEIKAKLAKYQTEIEDGPAEDN